MDRTGGRREAFFVACGTFVFYALFELRRHQTFETSAYDLGIFGQGMRAYSRFHAPTSELRAPLATFHGAGYPLLGDHFSPVLALLGPVYRVVPHIEVLLIVQALLIALSVYVLVGAATETLGHHGRGVPMGIGVAYALSWGIARMAGFDFHEVAFALPLLCLALRALLRERWTRCACWAAALLLVKEDLGLTVFCFGLLLLPKSRNRRAGIALCTAGPLFMAIAVAFLVPHFNPSHVYGYLGGEAADGSGVSGLISRPWKLPLDVFYPWDKALTLFFVMLTTVFLAGRSPMLALAIPALMLRFVADNSYYWGTRYHYSATLMPVIFFALIDALRRHPGLLEERTLGRLRIGRVGVTAPVVIAIALVPVFGLGEMFTSRLWSSGPRVTAANRAIAVVPSGVLVAAADDVAPHLVDRDTVYLPKLAMFDPGQPRIDWIVADTIAQGFKHEDSAVAEKAQSLGYSVVYSEDGYVVLHRS